MKKRVWIPLSAIILIIVVATTYYLLTQVAPRTDHHSPSHSVDKATQLRNAGITAEADGDSKMALKQYQQAYDIYKKEGDEAAALDMSYKIKFIKRAIAADEAATKQAIKNGDQPSEE